MHTFAETDRLATSRDVARIANVTTTTVSAALNGTGRISEKRRNQIRKIAKDIGYHPNIAAQIMRGNKTGQVGLIICAPSEGMTSSAIWSSVMTAFVRACEYDGISYHIEFCGSSTNNSSFEGPRQLLGRLVDGVLVAGFRSAQLEAWLSGQKRYPWVGLEEPAEHCVISNTKEGVYEAAKHLAALGHRRVAFGCGSVGHSTQHRMGMEAFRRSVSDFGLISDQDGWIKEFKSLTHSRQAKDECDAWARDLLACDNRPTAFICNDMRMARSTIYAAMLAGLNVPKNLSVIATGTAIDAEKASPWVSSIEADYREVVSKGLNMLRRMIAGQSVLDPVIQVRPQLVMRDTVGRVSDL